MSQHIGHSDLSDIDLVHATEIADAAGASLDEVVEVAEVFSASNGDTVSEELATGAALAESMTEPDDAGDGVVDC